MDREILKALLPIMQAFVDGKKIEYSNDGENWFETATPTWDTDFVYRIKPEPKYRLFRTQEECWQEMHKHPDFGWIVYDKIRHSICDVTPDEITILYECDSLGIDFKTGLEQVTFTDGEPFGVKEE